MDKRDEIAAGKSKSKHLRREMMMRLVLMENITSNERDDGDSDKEDGEYEANESEEESNKDEKSNKDEGSDQELVKNLETKIVKGKTTKGKKKDVAFESDEDEMAKNKVLKVKKNLKKKKKKQVFYSYSSFEAEKPIKKKTKLDVKKKKKKPLTPTQIKKEKYLSGFPILRSRTVPYSLFSAIRDSQVDMKSILSDVGFSSLHNVFIDRLPSRLARNSSCGTSIFDLPERPLDDDFVKMWFKRFDPKPLKDICATDIAENFIYKCLQDSTEPKTVNGFYIGPLTFLIKAKLEDLLRKASTQFSNDEDVRELDGEKVGTNVAGEKQTAVEAKDVVEDVVNKPQ
nr:hypothetical protein [Tanacetum cinerariifolium]